MRFFLSFLFLITILLGAGIDVQSQDPVVNISFKQNSDNSVDFNFQKNIPGTIFVSIKFDRLENAMQQTYKGCIRGTTGKVFTLKPRDPNKGIGFSWSYQYQRGRPISRLKKDFVYLLPFKDQATVKAHKLFYLGKQFGKGAPDTWAAYQFLTKQNEPVLAARKGLVVQVVDRFIADTSKTSTYTASVNEVIIEQRDGTLARYSGFKGGSVKVKEGQLVYPQQVLGLSGRYDSNLRSEIRFCVYYLNTRDIDNLDNKIKRMNIHSYVNPRFHWKGGESIILPRNDYVAESTEELIMQEFSRREKKKYLKGELN